MAKDTAPLPPPPNLHWSIVLVLSVITVGIFMDIWIIVQALWVRKFERVNRPLVLYIFGIALGIAAEILNTMKAPVQISAFALFGALVLTIVASFQVRDSLVRYIANVERRPRYLSGIMTIFLGPVYLQYHMNKVRSYQRQAVAASVR